QLTLNTLLPEALRQRHAYPDKLREVRPSSGHLCLYAGFKGSPEELGMPRTNLWVYPDADHEGNMQRFLDDPLNTLPMVYISFPSAKDPEWAQNYPGKSTVEVITLGRHEWFAQ